MTPLDPLPPDLEALLATAREQRADSEPPEQLLKRLTAAAERPGQLSPPASHGVRASAARQAPASSLSTVPGPSEWMSEITAEPIRRRMPKAANPSSLRRAFWPLALAAALGLVWTSGALSPEPSPQGPWQVQPGTLDEHPVFQSTAVAVRKAPAHSSGVPADGGLFSEQPFSEAGRHWRLRHWETLKADPTGDVVHRFDGGALCADLKAGQRIVGGFPRGSSEALAPLPTVALEQGQRYQLTFEAWSTHPQSSRLLIALGHASAPYSAAAGARIHWTSTPQRYLLDFTATYSDPEVGLAWIARLSAAQPEATVCLRGVHLRQRR